VADRENTAPSTPPSQSTDFRGYQGNDETEVVIHQHGLFPEENLVSSRSRDVEPLEAGHGTVTAHITSPNNQNTPCTDILSRSHQSIMVSLESPPTSGNFEWDERSDQPGGQRFVDGMGSLTSDIGGSGYLGIASLLTYVLFQCRQN
jgi:hypothetical protein